MPRKRYQVTRTCTSCGNLQQVLSNTLADTIGKCRSCAAKRERGSYRKSGKDNNETTGKGMTASEIDVFLVLNNPHIKYRRPY